MEPVPDQSLMTTLSKVHDADGNRQNISANALENLSITQEFDSVYDKDLRWNYDSINEYFYESARLAYKSDPDYKDLVQAIVVLEANQQQAQKDLSNLFSHRKRAAEDPLNYVQKIENKDLKLPKKRRVGVAPSIDWDKYGILRDPNFSKDSINGRSTSAEDEERSFGIERVSKFFKPWTRAEQSRLEDLLVLYPPEEIEMRRWEKIACALGTRSPIQVASRVQKYFLKLLKSGVPIPGRQPNIKSVFKNSQNAAYRQHNKESVQSNNRNGENKRTASTAAGPGDSSEEEEISDLEDINPDVKNTSEYQELVLVRKALREKLNASKLHNIPKVAQNGL